MRIIKIVSILSMLIGCMCVALAKQPPALMPLQFLIGVWKGIGSGKPGDSIGDSTFAASLQEQIIVRTSFADYPARGGQPAIRHDDLMVIYAEGSKAKADYFDSEGHVMHYEVRTGAAGEVVFLSEASPSAPRYRLIYRLAPDKTVSGQFEIAPPGTPEVFKSYLSWSMNK